MYNSSWRVLFFGSDHMSLTCLKSILQARLSASSSLPLVKTLEIVSQPIKLVGRGLKQKNTNALRTFAAEANLTVHDAPSSIRAPIGEWSILQKIKNKFDIGVVVSFGCFIPNELIASCVNGMINVHPSLLPKYRGASPIQYTIMNGDKLSGVSIIKVDPFNFDTGDILVQKFVNVDDHVKYCALARQLATEGAEQLVYVLRNFEELQQKSSAQVACIQPPILAPKIKAKDAIVQWNFMSATEVYNRWRALDETTGLFTYFQGKRVRLIGISYTCGFPEDASACFLPGSIIVRSNLEVDVRCKEGIVRCSGFQFDSRKQIDSRSFVNGYLYKVPEASWKFGTETLHL